MVPAIILTLGAMFITGLGVFRAGRRGRKIDNHRHCVRCDYDLTGLPDLHETCPECGGWLRSRTIRRGTFEPRPRLVRWGLALMLLPVLSGGMVLLCTHPKAPLGWKPDWWLDMEWRMGNLASADALSKRIAVGRVSTSRICQIADAVLARQADLNRPWHPNWGEMVEAAQARGQLDAARWQRYLQQCVIPDIQVRPKLCRGDDLPVRWEADFRTGWGTSHRIGVDPSIQAGSLVSSQNSLFGAIHSYNQELPFETIVNAKSLRPDAAEGTHDVVIGYTVLALPNNRGTASTAVVTVSKPVEVLPAGAVTSQAISRPDLEPAVRKCVAVRLHQELSIYVTPPPANLAFDVLIRWGGTELLVDQLYCPAASHPSPDYSFSFSVPPQVPDSVEVVLRGSERAATQSLDMKYWDGELVFKVERGRPTPP